MLQGLQWYHDQQKHAHVYEALRCLHQVFARIPAQETGVRNPTYDTKSILCDQDLDDCVFSVTCSSV
jgi:hypothetical protein